MDFRHLAGLAIYALLASTSAIAQEPGGAWLRNDKGDVINANTYFSCPGELLPGLSRNGVDVLEDGGRQLECFYANDTVGDKATLTFWLTEDNDTRKLLNQKLQILPINGFPVQLAVPEAIKSSDGNWFGVQADAIAENRSFTIIIARIADAILIAQLNHARDANEQAADIAWRATHDSAADVQIGLAQATGAAAPQFPRLLYPHLRVPSDAATGRPKPIRAISSGASGPASPSEPAPIPTEKPAPAPQTEPDLPADPVRQGPSSEPPAQPIAPTAPQAPSVIAPAIEEERPASPETPPITTNMMVQCATPYIGVNWVDARITPDRSQCLYKGDSGFQGFFRTQLFKSDTDVENWKFQETLIIARDFPQARLDTAAKLTISTGGRQSDCRTLRDGDKFISLCVLGIRTRAILLQVEYSEPEIASAQKFAQWLFDQHFGTAAPSSQ